MKRLISLAIILITVFGMLVGCKASKYPARKSTKEESRVVMTLSLDGDRYEVKYELYRALFLANKSKIDGGDSSVWSSENKNDYIDKINERIIAEASDIYSALHLANKLGLDIYSKDTDKEIDEYVILNVEGNGGDIIGYGGDYDAYLDDLAKRGINYAVQALLFRYSIALDRINEYYLGYEDEALGNIDGEYSFSEEDVRNFYFSDNSVRVLQAYVQADVVTDAKERMQSLRENISLLSPKDAALYIINHTAAVSSDLIVNKEVSGIVFGSHTLGHAYSDYSEAAFSLDGGEVSDIIEISDGARGYYVLYGLEKEEEHFSACYEDIKGAYLDDLIGKELSEISDSLAKSADKNLAYSDIIYAEISLD
ncbi:MAG: hypothetical protein E7676_07115 [Ruminococcaceae bacterium]|nr:hypothetical protein [Oscillospiraceae bacterium]